jgi:hypothetical protein
VPLRDATLVNNSSSTAAAAAACRTELLPLLLASLYSATSEQF